MAPHTLAELIKKGVEIMNKNNPDDDVWEEAEEEVESVEDSIDDRCPEGIDDGFNWMDD